MMSFGRAVFALGLSGLLAGGCGSRSSLEDLNGSRPSGSGGMGQGGSGGQAGAGGSGGDGGAGGCGIVVEVCDGIDNNCDGAIDEGNPGGGQACSTGLPGICSTGTIACTGGTLQCMPNVTAPEVCNAVDDDCDGAIDEGNPGGGAPCSTGLPGVCSAGTITCAGGMLACIQNGTPSAEACNGMDDDCDGTADEGNPGGGQACSTGLPGICNMGITACTAGMLQCIPTAMPSPEVCNGLDDDCDGGIDEGNPGGGAPCPTGLPGVCSAGTITCTGGMLACLPKTPPMPEQCNGLDDDCDGGIDEGNPGGGAPCPTGLPGVCATGTVICQGGMPSCMQTVMPSPETCNGLDDDCDGTADDGLSFCQCTLATFGGHTYAFCPQPSTWNAALAVCTAGGFHLVSINGAAENTFVFNTANTVSNEKWWIGLNDIAVEGTFVWEDGSPVTYTHWEPGEPNNSGNEDCAQINRFFPVDTWNDEPCDFQLFFICESP